MKLYKIKKSKIDNRRGLYASKDIREGTKIINYIGKIVTNKEVEIHQNMTMTNPFTYSHLIIDILWTEIFIGTLPV